MHKAGIKRPSPAMVVAVIALIAALGGMAWAALPKNSVGSRQLKAKSVTTAKIANGAVIGANVAGHTLSGSNINVSELGTVPSATSANSAGNSKTVGDHSATCPANTTLIRGVCFDSTPSGPVTEVQNAALECAKRGGWLPTPQELFSARGVLNLGDGTSYHSQFTDSYIGNTSGTHYQIIVVNSTEEKEVNLENKEGQKVPATYEYTCTYPLVR